MEALRNGGTRSAGQCEGPGRSTLPSSPGIRLLAVPPHGQPGLGAEQVGCSGRGGCTPNIGGERDIPKSAIWDQTVPDRHEDVSAECGHHHLQRANQPQKPGPLSSPRQRPARDAGCSRPRQPYCLPGSTGRPPTTGRTVNRSGLSFLRCQTGQATLLHRVRWAPAEQHRRRT